MMKSELQLSTRLITIIANQILSAHKQLTYKFLDPSEIILRYILQNLRE